MQNNTYVMDILILGDALTHYLVIYFSHVLMSRTICREINGYCTYLQRSTVRIAYLTSKPDFRGVREHQVAARGKAMTVEISNPSDLFLTGKHAFTDYESIR